MDTAPDTVEAARLAAALGSDIAVLLACAFAVAKGGRLAATVAAVVMAARLLSLACMAAGGPIAPMIPLAVEAALLLYLLSIAIFSRPLWTLFAAAFQFLVLLTRLVMLLPAPWAGETCMQVWDAALSAALLVGAMTGRAMWARDRP